MAEKWIEDAAGRIFSYASKWNEGRQKWDDRDIVGIIEHEMAQNAQWPSEIDAASPAPAGEKEERQVLGPQRPADSKNPGGDRTPLGCRSAPPITSRSSAFNLVCALSLPRIQQRPPP